MADACALVGRLRGRALLLWLRCVIVQVVPPVPRGLTRDAKVRGDLAPRLAASAGGLYRDKFRAVEQLPHEVNVSTSPSRSKSAADRCAGRRGEQ